jgi:hypothetical protein
MMQQPSNDPLEVPENDPDETPEELERKVAALKPLVDRAFREKKGKRSLLAESSDEEPPISLTPGEALALRELGLL